MGDINAIRRLYSPIQPGTWGVGSGVVYRETRPDRPLETFISCYWELKVTTPLALPFVYRVVADGCIDIYFNCSNPAESVIMGFSDRHSEFPLGNRFHYAGIRFLPTMFSQLFRIDTSSFTNEQVALIDVDKDLSDLIADKLNGRSGMAEISATLDQYFETRLRKSMVNDDRRLYRALGLILQSNGSLNIESALDTGISSRQLRRMFGYYIGSSAKVFSRVIRFQHFLQTRDFIDAGYYDQAHFIKEFKTLFGSTPSQAFAE